MRVDLGTVEVSEDDRRAIKRALGFKSGKASRHEVRVFSLAAVDRAVESVGMPDPEVAIRAAEESEFR